MKWHQATYGQTKKRIAIIRTQLTNLSTQPWNEEIIGARNALTKVLDTLLAIEEAYWKQQSMKSWLKEGDQNTRFFHQQANKKRARNRILGLHDKDEG